MDDRMSCISLRRLLVAKRKGWIARLSPEEVNKLERRHPELAAVGHHGSRQGITIVAPDSVLSAVQLLSERLVRDEDQVAGVLDALTLDAEEGVISMERLQQLRAQAEARNAFIRSVELLTSSMVGELGGSAARNTSALASRWKSEGRIFAVPSGRADLYPAFQFYVHGQPRPVIAEVLRHLEQESDWARALWWTSPSGWLDGRRPVDMLDEDTNSVIEAARGAAEPLEV